jgi:hypothetical protein
MQRLPDTGPDKASSRGLPYPRPPGALGTYRLAKAFTDPLVQSPHLWVANWYNPLARQQAIPISLQNGIVTPGSAKTSDLQDLRDDDTTVGQLERAGT